MYVFPQSPRSQLVNEFDERKGNNFQSFLRNGPAEISSFEGVSLARMLGRVV